LLSVKGNQKSLYEDIECAFKVNGGLDMASMETIASSMSISDKTAGMAVISLDWSSTFP